MMGGKSRGEDWRQGQIGEKWESVTSAQNGAKEKQDQGDR